MSATSRPGRSQPTSALSWPDTGPTRSRPASRQSRLPTRRHLLGHPDRRDVELVTPTGGSGPPSSDRRTACWPGPPRPVEPHPAPRGEANRSERVRSCLRGARRLDWGASACSSSPTSAPPSRARPPPRPWPRAGAGGRRRPYVVPRRTRRRGAERRGWPLTVLKDRLNGWTPMRVAPGTHGHAAWWPRDTGARCPSEGYADSVAIRRSSTASASVSCVRRTSCAVASSWHCRSVRARRHNSS